MTAEQINEISKTIQQCADAFFKHESTETTRLFITNADHVEGESYYTMMITTQRIQIAEKRDKTIDRYYFTIDGGQLRINQKEADKDDLQNFYQRFQIIINDLNHKKAKLYKAQ